LINTLECWPNFIMSYVVKKFKNSMIMFI
jgi:hypothetical protein